MFVQEEDRTCQNTKETGLPEASSTAPSFVSDNRAQRWTKNSHEIDMLPRVQMWAKCSCCPTKTTETILRLKFVKNCIITERITLGTISSNVYLSERWISPSNKRIFVFAIFRAFNKYVKRNDRVKQRMINKISNFVLINYHVFAVLTRWWKISHSIRPWAITNNHQNIWSRYLLSGC